MRTGVGHGLGRPERLGVHIAQVGEVGQVVVHQLVVGLVVDIAGAEVEPGIVEADRRRDQGLVSGSRLPHPHPDPAMLLDHRVGLHPGGARDHVLAGDLDTGPGPVELEAVIHAADRLALDPAFRKRRGTVAAAILHGDQGAVGGAIDHDRLVHDHPPDRGVGPQLVVPRSDVPTVADVHGRLHGDDQRSIRPHARRCKRNVGRRINAPRGWRPAGLWREGRAPVHPAG